MQTIRTIITLLFKLPTLKIHRRNNRAMTNRMNTGRESCWYNGLHTNFRRLDRIKEEVAITLTPSLSDTTCVGSTLRTHTNKWRIRICPNHSYFEQSTNSLVLVKHDNCYRSAWESPRSNSYLRIRYTSSMRNRAATCSQYNRDKSMFNENEKDTIRLIEHPCRQNNIYKECKSFFNI